MDEDPQKRGVVQRVVLLVSLAAALAGLEGRVLLRAFGQFLGLHPPWSFVLVSVALYGGAALVLLHFAGAYCPAVPMKCQSQRLCTGSLVKGTSGPAPAV